MVGILFWGWMLGLMGVVIANSDLTFDTGVSLTVNLVGRLIILAVLLTPGAVGAVLAAIIFLEAWYIYGLLVDVRGRQINGDGLLARFGITLAGAGFTGLDYEV